MEKHSIELNVLTHYIFQKNNSSSSKIPFSLVSVNF